MYSFALRSTHYALRFLSSMAKVTPEGSLNRHSHVPGLISWGGSTMRPPAFSTSSERWSSFMCNPPLCITEEQLREGFAIIDRGLETTDAVFEG